MNEETGEYELPDVPREQRKAELQETIRKASISDFVRDALRETGRDISDLPALQKTLQQEGIDPKQFARENER